MKWSVSAISWAPARCRVLGAGDLGTLRSLVTTKTMRVTIERQSLMSLTSRLMADSDMMASWAWRVQLALGQGRGHQEWAWTWTRADEAFERIVVKSVYLGEGPRL